MVPLMRTMPLLFAMLAAAAPVSAAERRYSIGDFDRVDIQGPYEVRIVTGSPSSSARATGDQASLDRVSVDVQGRTLRVRPNSSAWGGYPGDRPGPVTVELSTRDLRAVSVVGSGKASIDRVKGLRADLSVSGSGSLAAGSVDADTLVVSLLGSGRIALSGRTKLLRAAVQGTGDLDGSAFQGEDVELAADTAGTVTVGAVRTAKVRATGPGDVEIAGSPACTLTGVSKAMVRCGRQGGSIR